ncbi:MAG: hypothetical protein ACRD0K_07690, partial [Egibacteraceae bacterium]
PKLVASAVRAPDLSESTGTPVMLRLAPRQCTPEVVARLREVLCEHRGLAPVHLRLAGSGGSATTLRLSDDLRVRRNPGLYAELKTLLGAGAVA